jgi:hypothetical protein
MSYKKQRPRGHGFTPGFFVGCVLHIFFFIYFINDKSFIAIHTDRMALISEQNLQRSGNSPQEHRKKYINHYIKYTTLIICVVC